MRDAAPKLKVKIKQKMYSRKAEFILICKQLLSNMNISRNVYNKYLDPNFNNDFTHRGN